METQLIFNFQCRFVSIMQTILDQHIMWPLLQSLQSIQTFFLQLMNSHYRSLSSNVLFMFRLLRPPGTDGLTLLARLSPTGGELLNENLVFLLSILLRCLVTSGVCTWLLELWLSSRTVLNMFSNFFSRSSDMFCNCENTNDLTT